MLDSSPSKRRLDENGFLHVSSSHISKECVNPYFGSEIPDWQELGLVPDKIYYGYRSGAELARSATSFNGLPLLLGHHNESAASPQKEHRIGSLGTEASYNAPYLDNSLIITDASAIAAIESGSIVQLSSAYRFEPVFQAGEFKGERYDFIMTNLRGNHVALVEEGRAGPEVAVADQKPNLNYKRNKLMKKFRKRAKSFLRRAGLATDNAETLQAAEKLLAATENNSVQELSALCSLSYPEHYIPADLEAARLNAALAQTQLEPIQPDNDPFDNDPFAPAQLDNSPLAETLDIQEIEPELNNNATQLAELAELINEDEVNRMMQDAELDPENSELHEAFTAGIKAALTLCLDSLNSESRLTEITSSNPDNPSLSAADKAIFNAKKAKLSTNQTLFNTRNAIFKDSKIPFKLRKNSSQSLRQYLEQFIEAASSVRDICGDINALAFDSPADIYKHGLEQLGYKINSNEVPVLRQVLKLARQCKQNSLKAPAPVFDSRPHQGAFSGLNRINIQQ